MALVQRGGALTSVAVNGSLGKSDLSRGWQVFKGVDLVDSYTGPDSFPSTGSNGWIVDYIVSNDGVTITDFLVAAPYSAVEDSSPTSYILRSSITDSDSGEDLGDFSAEFGVSAPPVIVQVPRSPFSVVIKNAAGTTLRAFPGKYLISADYTKTRQDGYAEFTIVTNYDWSIGEGSHIQRGDQVEFYRDGVRRYRGYVTGKEKTDEEPYTLVIKGYGRMQKLRKQIIKSNYAYAGGGLDIGDAFRNLYLDNLTGIPAPGGTVLVKSVETAFFGIFIETIESKELLSGDIIDNFFMQNTGNTARCGVDVDEIGQDRVYFKKVGSLTNPTHVITIPNPNVEFSAGESDIADTENGLLIKGGQHKYPQLLHNGDLELPIVNIEGAGNLLLNAGFENGPLNKSNNVPQWNPVNGASLKDAKFEGDERLFPRTGDKCLHLDNNGEAVSQEITTTFEQSHTYKLDIWAAISNLAKTAEGNAYITWYNVSDVVVGTTTNVTLNPTTEDYEYFSLMANPPVGAVKVVVGIEQTDDGGAGWPIMIDDVSFYDTSVAYQEGWELFDSGTGTVQLQDWNCKEDSYSGSNCLAVAVTASDNDNNDVVLRPSNKSYVKVEAGRSYRFEFAMKSPRSPMGSYDFFSKIIAEIEWKKADGNNQSNTRATFTEASYIGSWIILTVTGTCPSTTGDNAVAAANPQVRFRSNGTALIDALSLRSSLAPLMDDEGYLPEGDLRFYIKADDSYLNNTFLPSPADYENSETDYGLAWQIVDEPSIRTREDALRLADSIFKVVASEIKRPSIRFKETNRKFEPGDTVKVSGYKGVQYSGEVMIISAIRESYDGMFSLSLDLERNQPDPIIVIQKMIKDALRKYGPAISGSNQSNYSNNTNNSGSGGFNAGSIEYRTTLKASDADSTLHDDYRIGPHVSDSEHNDIATTKSEVVAARTDTYNSVTYPDLQARLDYIAAHGVADWIGAWNSGTTYIKNNLVRDQNSSWISLQNGNINHAPPTLPTTSNTWWDLVALKGADGVDGDDGADILFGTGTPSGGLGVDGDLYINDANLDLYRKISGTWTLVDNIRGSQILTGSGVPSSGLGSDGDFYVDYGSDNYYLKITGGWVLQGNMSGAQFLFGTGIPGAGTGNDGDVYLRTTTSDLYKKVTGAWNLEVNIKGADGRGFTPTGAWDNSTAYTIDQIVQYDGGTYRAIVNNTNVVPDSNPATWEQWAAPGADGAPGTGTPPIKGTFANASARTTFSATPGDVDYLFLQLDDNSYWHLKDDSPLTWQQLSGGSGSRSNISVTVTAVPAGTGVDATISMGKAWRVLQIEFSTLARVRAYTTAAERAADVSRPVTTRPNAGYGILLDMYVMPGVTSFPKKYNMSPPADGYNADGTVVTTCYLRIDNRSTITDDITIVFTKLTEES